MAMDMWCTLFFLLNLRPAKEINKEDFNVINPLPSRNNFDNPMKELLRGQLWEWRLKMSFLYSNQLSTVNPQRIWDNLKIRASPLIILTHC